MMDLLKWLEDESQRGLSPSELVPRLVELGERLDVLQRAGAWEALEEIFGGLDLERVAHPLVITLLGTTYAARDKIPSWGALACRTAAHRAAQDKPLKGLLKGWVGQV